jgi:putative ATP-binding cassette transporter
MGLYEPGKGTIILDGKPVTRENRDDYRQYFSVVFFDFFLFEHLIGIGMKDPGDRIKRYLEELQLTHKVKVQDGRLSTIELSQGQRKRLALFNAYVEDRPIYIFDEWAADQDPQFKEVFYRDILAELKAAGKTVIVISHDDRYYHLADRIIKLDGGKVEYDRSVVKTTESSIAGIRG